MVMKWKIISIIILLICFVYPMNFLVRYGEMFGKGSDVVSNVAYGMTMFQDVHQANWSVPKPVQMILFGLIYWITGNLWFIHVLFAVAGALLVYCACHIMGQHYATLVPFLVFAVLTMVTPFIFGAMLGGGSGLLSTLFLFIALVYLQDLSPLRNRLMVIIFLSVASLARPDNWVNVGLIVTCVFGLKYLPRNRPRFNRIDLLFLIPLLMPVVWHIWDYAIFGNVFFSGWLAQRFAIEYAGHSNSFDWQQFPGLLKSAFFNAFHVSSWVSLRALVYISLSVIGVVVMFMKQPRMLLFMACSFFGSIAFYFITHTRGMLFLGRFLFYNYVFILFALSVGIAQLGVLILHLPVRYLRNILQIAWVFLIVMFIVYTPFRTKILVSLPHLKTRANMVKQENKAIQALKGDLPSGEKPIILSTLSVSSSRIALQLGMGEGLYLLERLAGPERIDDVRLISNTTGLDVPAFAIRFHAGSVEFWGSTWQPVIPKFEDNQWGHYAFVFDDKTNVTGYYNGKKGLTVQDNCVFTDIGIGANFIGQWGQHFTGLMDEVAFFNVALTQDEVVTIKENSLAEADVQRGSVAMWLFDEGTGKVAKDSSGNGNDGALKNVPQWVVGKVGQALKFDGGKKSYVDVGNLGLKEPVTLVFWAKPTGLEEHIVVQSSLPALKNHLVYVAYETSVKGRIRSLIQMVEEKAIQTGTVFEENGLRIRRCIY